MNEERFVSAFSDTYEEEENRLAKNSDGNGFSWQYCRWLEGKLSDVDEKLRLVGKAAGIDVDDKFEELLVSAATLKVVKADETIKIPEAPAKVPVSDEAVPDTGQVQEVAKDRVLPDKVPQLGSQPPKAA